MTRPHACTPAALAGLALVPALLLGHAPPALAAPAKPAPPSIPVCDAQGKPPDKRDKDHLGYVSQLAVYLANGKDNAGSASPELRRIPMGVELLLLCRSGSSVLVQARTEDGPQGWVKNGQFESARPQAGRLLAELAALPADDVRRRRGLAERALELEPLNPATHHAMIQVLEAGGDKRALAAARARLDAMASGAVVRQQGEPQLIFISTTEGVKMFAMLRNGKLLGMPGSGSDEPLPGKLLDMAFQPGRILHVHAGGVSRKIQVTGMAQSYCDAQTAAVRPFDGGETQGIATNYPLRPSPAYEVPVPAAYGTMNTIIANILRRNGVHPAYRERMLLRPSKGRNALEGFAAVPVRGGANPLLIASVSVEDNDSGPSYSLTVIAEADKTGKYRLAYEDFNIGSGGGEAGMYADTFHYNADLDGDGIDELILSSRGYEWGSYFVIQKVAGKWSKTVHGASYGC